MGKTKYMETERLILRPFTSDDEEALLEILSDKEVNTFLPWFPLQSLSEVHQFLEEKYLNCYRNNEGYGYAICLKADNRPIGYVNVSGEDNYDFGYGLRKEYWHQGIVTEACQAVIEQIKKDGLPYITATHDVKNPYSGMVMKKLGMTYQYSYQEQWFPKNITVIFRMYQLNFKKNQQVFHKYWDMYPHFIEEIGD